MMWLILSAHASDIWLSTNDSRPGVVLSEEALQPVEVVGEGRQDGDLSHYLVQDGENQRLVEAGLIGSQRASVDGHVFYLSDFHTPHDSKELWVGMVHGETGWQEEEAIFLPTRHRSRLRYVNPVSGAVLSQRVVPGSIIIQREVTMDDRVAERTTTTVFWQP